MFGHRHDTLSALGPHSRHLNRGHRIACYQFVLDGPSERRFDVRQEDDALGIMPSKNLLTNVPGPSLLRKNALGMIGLHIAGLQIAVLFDEQAEHRTFDVKGRWTNPV